MVEGCESMDDYSDGTEDFIELPAITKPSRSSVDHTNVAESSPPQSKSSNPQSKGSPSQSSGNAQSVSPPPVKLSRDGPIHSTSYVNSDQFYSTGISQRMRKFLDLVH